MFNSFKRIGAIRVVTPQLTVQKFSKHLVWSDTANNIEDVITEDIAWSDSGPNISSSRIDIVRLSVSTSNLGFRAKQFNWRFVRRTSADILTGNRGTIIDENDVYYTLLADDLGATASINGLVPLAGNFSLVNGQLITYIPIRTIDTGIRMRGGVALSFLTLQIINPTTASIIYSSNIGLGLTRYTDIY